MQNWEWGKEIIRRWLYLMSSKYIIHLFGCFTRGSWPLHLPPLELQISGKAISHSHSPQPVWTGRASQTQAVQKVQYYLYFKYLTSYIHCLWSPLLGDWGVLGELFVTIINCFHSNPILLRMEDKERPEYTPTIRAIVRIYASRRRRPSRL